MKNVGELSLQNVRCSWQVLTCHCLLCRSDYRTMADKMTQPVRPNNPTRSLALRLKESPCMMGGNSGAYLITRSSTTTRAPRVELDGQYAGGWLLWSATGSCGIAKYSTTRSTELYIILDYNQSFLKKFYETNLRSCSREVQNLRLGMLVLCRVRNRKRTDNPSTWMW